MQSINRNIVLLIIVSFLLVFTAHWISDDDFFIREGLLPTQWRIPTLLSMKLALPLRLKLDGVVFPVLHLAFTLLSYFWFLKNPSELAKKIFLWILVIGFISEMPFLVQLLFPFFLEATPMIFLNNVALSLVLASQLTLIYLFSKVRKIEQLKP